MERPCTLLIPEGNEVPHTPDLKKKLENGARLALHGGCGFFLLLLVVLPPPRRQGRRAVWHVWCAQSCMHDLLPA